MLVHLHRVKNSKKGPVGSLVCIYQLSEEDKDLWVIQWCKHAEDKPYLKHYEHGFMHRIIAERIWGHIPEGWEIDHIDHDQTNNLRSNLRLATKHGQMLNQRKAGQSVRQTPNGR